MWSHIFEVLQVFQIRVLRKLAGSWRNGVGEEQRINFMMRSFATQAHTRTSHPAMLSFLYRHFRKIAQNIWLANCRSIIVTIVPERRRKQLQCYKNATNMRVLYLHVLDPRQKHKETYKINAINAFV
jgi:hypothetical protein